MAGLKEIALASGVSTTAVSDILNRGREDRYRPETRDRVLAAIQELGYQPDRTAQSMRLRRTRMIGFVAPNLNAEGRLENMGVYAFLVGLSHGLTPNGYHAAVVELDEIETGAEGEVLPPVLKERFFDALVLQYGLAEAAIRLAEHVSIPVLRWDTNKFDSENCLRRDEVAVTRELMERLIGLGHRRVAFLVGGLRWDRYQAGLRIDHYSYADRYETYCECVRSLGQQPLPLNDYRPDILGQQLQASRPTAVIAPEADGARATVDAALSLGLQVPRDLTVATLDREACAREVGRLIGGMSYDRVAVGRQAAGMVQEMLEKGGSVVSRTALYGDWVVGDTIAEAARTGINDG